ncbi:unnamed protein product [Cochlearia groenlandica]
MRSSLHPSIRWGFVFHLNPPVLILPESGLCQQYFGDDFDIGSYFRRDCLTERNQLLSQTKFLFVRERGELVRLLGGAKTSTSLFGVPLGHNSYFLQGPNFAPPRTREAIWCSSTNSSTEEG